jgi:peptide/nickel transport system permease protein
LTATTQTKQNPVANLEHTQRRSRSLWRIAFHRLLRDYLTLGAIFLLSLLILLALLAPVISDIMDISYTRPNTAIDLLPIGSEGHPLGTDQLGRDMLARLLYGGRVSLAIGVLAAFFSAVIGVTLGLIAGYNRGGPLSFIDDVIMWSITTLNSIPTLVLLILIASVASPSIPTLILVLVLVSWTGTMRLMRGETISYREQEFVLSARAVGAGSLRIMFVHILPNTLSVLITTIAIQIGTLILVEAALSFLGLGVRPPEPSWGNMLTDAQAHFRQGPHLSIMPGILIVITVLCFYLIGDGLRDALDPKMVK